MKKKIFIISIVAIICFFCIASKFLTKKVKYVAISIPPENEEVSIFDKDGNQSEEERSISEWCNINAACIREGKRVKENGLELVVATENGVEIYKKTVDKNFLTQSGLSIKDPVSKYLEIYGNAIFIEPGTCAFIQLENDWRACIASSDLNVKLDGYVLYFYKVKEGYTHSMTLGEWNRYISGVF
ncbi:MAG: hypothetical protein J5817_07840 [Treponema sp.]|nr:hypothetical protein [Treponema sp.]